MINKQNLWFITLFSLIMVLSIYYLTMNEDTFTNLNVNSNNDNKAEVVISEENETLVALKVSEEEALVEKMENLQNTILSTTATVEEKNKAYEELQSLNKSESERETLEKLVKDTYKLDSVVNIDGNNIKVTVSSKELDVKLANNIIRSIQNLYQDTKYISIKYG